MSRSLVQPVLPGPIDIVADVHGEIQALVDLMRHLGYSADGTHPDGRGLVFLGDLTDVAPTARRSSPWCGAWWATAGRCASWATTT